MKCQYFSRCNGCSLPLTYKEQIQEKIKALQAFGFKIDEIHTSPSEGYRCRAEFRIYRDEKGLHYALSVGNRPLPISSCTILLPHLQILLDKLLPILNASESLKNKLFSVEVLGTLQQQSLLVLLYHRKLDQVWEREAKQLERILNAHIIGRSRGEKKVLSQDFLKDSLNLGCEKYTFIRYDNAFSQPNPHTNVKMVEFTLQCIAESRERKDLLELYCGGGNFTIPLSKRFNKVFATEIAKSSIKALNENIKINAIDNIFCARLSGEESISALSGEREFFRLRGLDLSSYEFSHIFIDPPRSGVGDIKMLEFISHFENIIYISCNPHTLKEDLFHLCKTHNILRFALFDQFPYTHHIESGVWLVKKDTK